MNSEFVKLKKLLLIFLLLLIVGTIGYSILLKVSILNALYMTVITVSTVGYKEVAQMNPKAVVFSIFIILWGIGVVGYALSSLAVVFVEGHIRKLWRGRFMDKKIKKLKGHYIICGYNDMCIEIAKELLREEEDFLILDEDIEDIQAAIEAGYIAYAGSPVKEDDLLQIGIKEASGLVTVQNDDVENIVTVLTARELNPKLNIVSLANEASGAIKLRRVGADNVLSTSQIGGRRLAALLTKPHVISFLDVLTKFGDVEFDLEEIIISPGATLDGQNLAEAKIPAKTGLMVFAVRKAGKDMILNPSGQVRLSASDVLLVLGQVEQIDKLRKLASSS